jgi:hypothetical protein
LLFDQEDGGGMLFPNTVASQNSVTTPNAALFIGTTVGTLNPKTFFLHSILSNCALYPADRFMILFQEFKL